MTGLSDALDWATDLSADDGLVAEFYQFMNSIVHSGPRHFCFVVLTFRYSRDTPY